MSHVDPYPTKINNIRYDVMRMINDNVHCVARFAGKNPNSDAEDYIRQVTEKIEDLFGGQVGPHEYVLIVRILRGFVEFVRHDHSMSVDEKAAHVTDSIIETVQGDTEMSKATISAMVYRRVNEAVTWAAGSTVGSPDRIDEIVEDCTTRIMNDVFGEKSRAEIQAAEYTPAYYDMDPETEDLLDNGTLVVDGMKVLVEDHSFRADIHDAMLEASKAIARKNNRWCVVSNAKVINEATDTFLSFVGIYDDGTKRKWYVSTREAWFVKKDTISRVDGIYCIADESIQFNGIPKDVASALRSLAITAWDKYLVQVGGHEFETVSEYLWRVEQIEYADETDINRYIILRNEEGEYITAATNHAIVKAYVKRFIEPVNFGNYTVQTPETNVPKPLLDYLGINDELVVWDEEGTEVFKGTREEIRKWADSPTGRRGKYLGYEVAREGLMGGISLKDFMLGRME